MALEPTSDPLDRALQAAREETPEGWVELSQSVMSRVRGLVAPSDPVLAFGAEGSDTHDATGSRTFVSTRVIAASLRRLLQGAPTHAPERIDLEVVDDRLVAVELTFVCSYGVDLRALAGRLRDDVLTELTSLIGPDPELGPAMIDIEIADVVDGDPNLV